MRTRMQQPLEFKSLRKEIVGIDTMLDTPFGSRLMLYADYTASGRSLKFIEDYLVQLQTLYANTHTEDDTSGRVTTQLLHDAERLIKKAVNAGPKGCVIACGSGATAAIDRMQQLVGIKFPSTCQAQMCDLMVRSLGQDNVDRFNSFREEHQPVVFVGPYEHHSNEVSWREGMATVVEVDLDEAGGVCLEHLELLLQQEKYQGRLRIGSFSAASNVTGMKTDVGAIAVLLHKYDALAFFDYAASAPYVDIDMNPPGSEDRDACLDAVFISPHKFLGGPGSSGILVFNSALYQCGLSPSVAGGGTVDYVGPKTHDFIEDIETRENAGTPAVLQTIKAALVFELKQSIGVEKIQAREDEILERVFERWSAHPNIEILGNEDPKKRVGIVSLNIKSGARYLHPRFVTRLLDDLFGIQSRAGCSCAGPYGHRLLGISEELALEYRSLIAEGYQGFKPGWVRISFHYIFDDADVDYLIDCMEFIAEFGGKFLPLYHFDQLSGLWVHKNFQEENACVCLADALKGGAYENLDPKRPASRVEHYHSNLAQARFLADDLGDVQDFEAEPDGDQSDLVRRMRQLQFFEMSCSQPRRYKAAARAARADR